jgi:hypothetical protein
MEQKVGEVRLLLAAPDRDRPSVLDDLQGTQGGIPRQYLESTVAPLALGA